MINLVKKDKVVHSYLFVGTEGIGKKLIARKFSKMLLCIDDNNKYCNNCKSCLEFDTNNNPDYKEIEPDGNSIKILQIRDLQSKIQEKPIISKNKVFVIDNADLMTKEAQNCLLKTLEEPPEFAKIILIGSNESSFLNTIKSRCMITHFKSISDEDMIKFLKENEKIENITKEDLQLFQGSIKKAIELKDKKNQYENINQIFKTIKNDDIIELINRSELLYKSKDEIEEILDYINTILIKKSIENAKYAQCIHIVEDTKKRLKQNANYDMCIDNMLFCLWEEMN